MQAMIEARIAGREPAFRGKVRDVYEIDNHLLIVTTDRISAFDVVLPTPIPGKGSVLTHLSNFWFDWTADMVPNHLTTIGLEEVTTDKAELTELADRSVVVRKAEPLKIEAIVRGYLAGSGWLEYQSTGSVSGLALPSGLRESERLPQPIFTPSTKAPAGKHDENIDFDGAVGIVGPHLAELVRDTSVAIYRRAAAYAETRGIILADSKFEFGLCDGELTLIDELLTPDSSRFWDSDAYEPGRPQASFDKQFVRDYLTGLGWERQPPAPDLPPYIVSLTADKYRDALERLTGVSI